MSSVDKNILNLNIPTFIREIYNALKHIDLTMNNINDSLNNKINLLENNQQKILNRIDELELFINKIYENTKAPVLLNKSIEQQLSEKISKLNTNTSSLLNDKIELKSDELTLANIMENNYNFEDINNVCGDLSLSLSLSLNEFNSFIDGNDGNDGNDDDNNTNLKNSKNQKNENLDTLLF